MIQISAGRADAKATASVVRPRLQSPPMCVACFTTAQLAAVGAVSARWWWVNKWQPAQPDDAPVEQASDEEHAPVA
jgi:hypothetical protein